MKTIKIPYKKYKNILFIKKIDYDIKKKYKKITYLYETYIKDKEVKETIHKDGYPAIIIYLNNKINELQYWKHGELHREHGPSILKLNNKHEIIYEKWYIKNKELTEKEIDDLKKIIDRRKKMFKVILKMKSKN